MTDILQIGIPTVVATTNQKPVIEAMSQAVNVLQGAAADKTQRAVRKFEFDERMAQLEARLKKAGY